MHARYRAANAVNIGLLDRLFAIADELVMEALFNGEVPVSRHLTKDRNDEVGALEQVGLR